MSHLDDMRENLRAVQKGAALGPTKSGEKTRQYFYKDPDGEFRWHDTPAPKTKNRDGAGWPMEMIALGCHTEQIEEFNKSAQEEGLTGVKWVDKDGLGGTCIVESRQERNKLLEKTNMCDRDAGYGDRAPQNY